MSDNSQIFQTATKTRWQRFKWAGRLFLFFTIIAVVVIVIAMQYIDKNEPDISVEGRAMKKVLTEAIPEYRESKLGKEYRGFRKAINARWAVGKGCGQMDSVLDLSNSPLFSDSVGIRAAFYVAWDKQSFTSLERNISKLNLVIPEWFFIDPTADTLYTNIDAKALNLMKAAGVEIMPILSNNYKQIFRGESVHSCLLYTSDAADE